MESSREQLKQNSNYIDIWRLKLDPNSTDFIRMTRWGDYPGFKASNPVVSPDGKRWRFNRPAARTPPVWATASSS